MWWAGSDKLGGDTLTLGSRSRAVQLSGISLGFGVLGSSAALRAQRNHWTQHPPTAINCAKIHHQAPAKL